ncbi:MAG: dihydrodipicolinate synthase family protein, partial [Bacteroidetes bacterium]|nr:dihydrodipicolinate synthase family protein [Bacteroidota bacterium]MDA1334163.1 dihydrodipicolinate synthase family protein [Bacteroidota bacterium]
MNFQGVLPILPTPFTDTGAVDEASMRRLIDFEMEVGVHGVSILGFMGEAHKMAESERKLVVRTVVEQTGGHIPTWVGVRAFGTAGAIEQAREAQELGASAVFVAPIGIQADEPLFQHYAGVADAVDIPVIIHDFPESFGTILSASLIVRMSHEIPGVQYIKLEELPVLDKLTAIRKEAASDFGIFGGLGGEYFLEELQRGANGIMTGFAFPDVLVGIYNAFRAGDEELAAAIFDRYIPLIRYEFQPKIGLAYRKFIYQKRGVISTQYIRPPGRLIDAYTERELTGIIKRVGLDLGARGVQKVEPWSR